MTKSSVYFYVVEVKVILLEWIGQINEVSK